DAAYRRAQALVFRYGWNATAYQILNPDIELWFAADGNAVVGFVRRQRTCVVAGAPVCEASRVAEVAQEFEREMACAGWHVCYFGAAARLQRALQSLPAHALVAVGSQPVWKPTHWHEIPARNASLRAQIHRARNKGVTVSEWLTERAHNHPELQRCLDE